MADLLEQLPMDTDLSQHPSVQFLQREIHSQRKRINGIWMAANDLIV